MDLERCLAIQQPMHKKKLRLAIEELRQPHLCKYPYISQLNHGWVAAEWLPDVGLAQYAELFSAHLMDGRMLAHLTKKDMERYLNVTRKFHQVSGGLTKRDRGCVQGIVLILIRSLSGFGSEGSRMVYSHRVLIFSSELAMKIIGILTLKLE